MVLKASLEKSTHNKHVAYLKQWMVYAKEIGSIKTHYVLHFFLVSCLIQEWNTLPQIVQNMQLPLFFIFQPNHQQMYI